MDPRKIRDPRLANRADPRLAQGNVPVGQPFNVNTSTVAATSAEVTTSARSNNDFTGAVDAAGAVKKVKTKPLFCVVCASNQVSTIRHVFPLNN